MTIITRYRYRLSPDNRKFVNDEDEENNHQENNDSLVRITVTIYSVIAVKDVLNAHKRPCKVIIFPDIEALLESPPVVPDDPEEHESDEQEILEKSTSVAGWV